MKKGFWNKKGTDFTGGDAIKYLITLYAIYMVFYGATMMIACKADEIGDFFKSLWTKIRSKLTRNYEWVERKEEEEEEPLW